MLPGFVVVVAAGSDRVWVASVIRQRQHFGKECRILASTSKLCASNGIEFVELALRGVIVRKSSSPLHLADDRIKRAVGVLR